MVIQLSHERSEQLKTFAAAQGVGITDAIGVLLHRAGAADKVPGFDIVPWRFEPGRKPCAYTLIFEGFNALLSPENVGLVADHIDHCADTAGTGGHEITLSLKGKEIGLLTVARHRRHSVVIAGKKLPNGETITRVLTLDVARDLANQLRRAVA